ncbi:MAG TPA: protein translocase subunit SecF [Ilumatobacter sp.]|nr:protein translocase subunit SecF [Ilumatobacter sp.]
MNTQAPPTNQIQPSVWGRLSEVQTAVDFVGRRKPLLILSCLLMLLSVVSLSTRELNLGIDFEGGVSWDVPAAQFDEDAATAVLDEAGVSTEGARIQRRGSESGDFIKVQVAHLDPALVESLSSEFAAAAGVESGELNVSSVSSSWGSEITGKAVRALVIFSLLVSIYIAIRFDWRMAIAAIVAMLHDVLIAVGIYSVLQFIVTPATVIAFLTILGYSLYDTIVVFDRVRENEARFIAQQPPYDDIVNVSTNQVLMRSVLTSFSSVVPVVSMLVVGAGLLGASTLSEFAVALLVGMVIGVYSSIVVAVPLLAILKKTDPQWGRSKLPRATGETLREMVMGGGMTGRRARLRPATSVAAASTADVIDGTPSSVTTNRVTDPLAAATQALSHPPRPSRARNKKRR